VTPEQAFLQDIIAHPEDDAPRLIYADWLDDRGQPGDADRAEFIRAQVGLASGRDAAGNTLTKEERKKYARDEETLASVQQGFWREQLWPLGVMTFELRRGFPEVVSMAAADFLARGEELFRLAPVRGVRLMDLAPEHVPALAASPHLSRLTTLDLSWNGIDAAGAQALAASPRLARLTWLNLSYNVICDAGAQALAASPHLARLTTLNLRYNGIDAAGAQALAASPHLRGLTYLNLNWNNIEDAGAQAVAASPHLARLTTLDLSCNNIGDAGARALAASPHLARLNHLYLSGNDIGAEGARALAVSPHLARLTHLYLSGNLVSPAVDLEIAREIARRRQSAKGHRR
jgi:uncharacterized protein (TIGR02996 family)